MDKPIAQQNSSTTATAPGIPPNNDSTAQLEEFWGKFKLFPWDCDKYAFDHWYYFIVGSYLYFLIPVLLSWIIQVNHPGQILYPEYALIFMNGWLMGLLPIALCLIVLSYNYWQKGVPAFFQSLLNKDRIRPKSEHSDLKTDYLDFLEDYQSKLLAEDYQSKHPNKRPYLQYLRYLFRRYLRYFRYLFVGGNMIAALILLGLLEVQYIASPTQFSIQWVVVVIALTPPAFIMGYLFGVSAWTLLISGRQIRGITWKFDLNVEPSHPDHCGGLRSLGRFCLDMALPILVGVVYFSIFGVGGSIFPVLINGQKGVRAASNISLFIFDLPLAIAFFLSLWGIHRVMVEKKDEYEDKFADSAAELERKIWAPFDQRTIANAEATKKAIADADKAKKEMDILQVLNPSIYGGYPSWPFDRSILFIYLVPQILTILSFIVPLLKP